MNLKNLSLLFSVFTTGCAVLIIEILAIRILSPHYGNTMYATSSVIGIVLMALSLGYYVGGILADRYPKHTVFYSIISLSGFFVILIQIFNVLLLPLFGKVFSITVGPLFSSLAIFFVPGFILGLLSPFAVKLYETAESNVGRRSGQVFFWSTLGSIVGSLASGFFLIPYFGISTIILATGLILSLLGLSGLFIIRAPNKLKLAFIALLLIELTLIWFFAPSKKGNVVYEKDGIYEDIQIIDGVWNNQPARFLTQDKSSSAAMYLNSDELVYNYTKYYELYKLVNAKAKNFFLIGGGAYSIPKALLSDSSTTKVTVAEIEPELFSLAKEYFNLKDDTRLINVIEDGRRLLSTTDEKYDAIISDVYYSFFAIPTHFTTKEFFSLAKSKLGDNGVFIGNFAGDLDQSSPSFIFSEIRTFKEVFPNSYFFAVSSPNIQTPQNIIFLGINGDNKIDFEDRHVANYTNPIFAELYQKNIDISKIDLSKYKEITDNFAPVEYLVSKVIKKWY